MIKLSNSLRKLIKEYKESREQYLNKVKEEIKTELTTPWSDEKLKSFNITLIANSAGWLGPHTEKEAKIFVLHENAYLFSEEEYEELKNAISSDTKILKK